jgi:fatty-acyl-CoA synthase
MRTPLTIGGHLDRAAAVYGERVAFVDEPDAPGGGLGTVTYARMHELARGQAAVLDARGIGLGERVAVLSQNSGRLLVSFFGVSGFGRVLVPINFRLSPAEVEYILEHSGASMLLVDPELAESVAHLSVKHRVVLGGESDVEVFGDGSAQPAPWSDQDEDATATINYTSGTTARPKGVELTHRNLWTNSSIFGWHTGVNDRDAYLHTLPMFHCNGWGMPYALAAMGVPQVVLRKVDGAEILRRVDEHGITLLCAAPAVVSMTLEAASSLTINRRRAEWDDLSPADRAAKLARAGMPAVGIELSISAQGEVLARGNHILKSYWDQPEATDDALEGGWFHTGDGGDIDDEGYLSISDRRKDVIISGGENVSSIEVEDALFSHPAVAEVAVIGVPDERWGETIKALVVVAAGQSVTEDELRAWCKERLAGYKCPTSVELRDRLAPEVQAPCALLGRPRPPGELTGLPSAALWLALIGYGADAPPLPDGVRPAEGRARRPHHRRASGHRPQDRGCPGAG